MSALSPFGIVHTIIGVVALGSGLVALVQKKEIDPHTNLGKFYLASTLVTALSGIVIFHHGGFGPPHALSILTVLAIGVGLAAAYRNAFGSFSRTIQIVSFSATIVFHLIPGFNETLTRVPVGAPIASGPTDPALQVIGLVIFAAFALGLRFQLRHFKRSSAVATLTR